MRGGRGGGPGASWLARVRTDSARALLRGPSAAALARQARRAGGAFLVRVAGAALGLLLNIAVARLLGVAGFGSYAFALSLLLTLAVVVSLGAEGFVTREIAANLAQGRAALAAGLIRGANLAVALAGLALLLLGLAALAGGALDLGEPVTAFAPAILVGAPLAALTMIQQATLQGYGRVLAGYAVGFVTRPACALLLLGAAVLTSGPGLAPVTAVALYAVASGLALAVGIAWARRARPDRLREVRAGYDWPAWSQAIPWVFFTSVVYVLQQHVDTFMLQYFLGAEGVGFYRPALQLVALATFAAQAVYASLQPAMAAAYGRGDLVSIQRLAIDAARILTAIGGATTLGCILFGEAILSIFGPDFARAAPVLIVLSLAPLVQGILGPGWLVLAMTRRDRRVAQGFAAGAILQILLGLALIPALGTIGAALGYLLGSSLRSLLFLLWIRTELGIDPTVLALHPRP